MNYTVYMHTAPNGKRYVGITGRKPERRWRYGHSYAYHHNIHFMSAIDKYGWDNMEHIIVSDNLTFEEACQMEVDLIKQYRTNEREFGYNKTAGGDGSRGKRVNQYSEQGKFIKTWDCISLAADTLGIERGNISSCCTDALRSCAGGYVWRYYNGDTSDIEYYRGIKKGKRVAQFSKDGEFIQEFSSLAEAARQTPKAHSTNILKNIKGQYKTCAGYIWKYVEEVE